MLPTRLKGRSAMDLTTLMPILTALIAGVFGFFGGPALAGWFARRGQKSDAARQKDREVAAARLAADQADRQLVSADMQWIVTNLRGEIEALYASQREMRAQLADLGAELDTVRRANTALRIENDQLKEQLAGETTKRAILERRVDDQDAAMILMRRELTRHGIPIPALAKEQP